MKIRAIRDFDDAPIYEGEIDTLSIFTAFEGIQYIRLSQVEDVIELRLSDLLAKQEDAGEKWIRMMMNSPELDTVETSKD